MKSALKKFARTLLAKAGYSIVRTRPSDQQYRQTYPAFAPLWRTLSLEQRAHISPYLAYSDSQFAQDLFVVLRTLHRDIAPFFVEFGAADGIAGSNTHMLESRCGWDGILAEPARTFHDALQRNRTCRIDLRCVAERSGEELEFMEATVPAFSGISEFADGQYWRTQENQSRAARYFVKTVSLNDLLEQHGAPRRIGYLSIDTEGSEFAILKSFDFSRRTFDVITVEHNWHQEKRTAIHQLLTSHGYRRLRADISVVDDWYVHDS